MWGKEYGGRECGAGTMGVGSVGAGTMGVGSVVAEIWNERRENLFPLPQV